MPDGASDTAAEGAAPPMGVSAEAPALADLYARYSREILAFVRGKVGAGPPEPEDVTHEAFANFAAANGASEVQNPRAFLYRAAANLVVNHHRHAAVMRRHALDVATEEFSRDRDELSPEVVLLNREQLRLAEAAIRKLPPKQRRYLLMNRLDGMSYTDIARVESLNESVVRRHVAKAMRAIVRVIDGGGGQ